jgi:hypothetical protein
MIIERRGMGLSALIGWLTTTASLVETRFGMNWF